MTTRKKIKSLATAGLIMSLGLLLFKYVPMQIWGSDILFDASLHITATIFVLFVLWYFIDQNKRWHMPFLAFSLAVVFIVAMQRVLANAHNDIGLLLGLSVSILAIVVARWDYFRGRFDF